MKNTCFDNAYNYARAAVALFPEMSGCDLVDVESLGFLMTMNRTVLDTLMRESTEAELDGKTFDVFIDKVDDPDFVLPDDLAVEVVRRVRKMHVLV